MIKLMKKEMMKNKIWKYIGYAGICIASCIGAILVVLTSASHSQELHGQDILPRLILVVFLVFTSFMHGNFTVNEFKEKTITLMFSYPISRRKILLAKILTVSLFCFVMMILAHILIYGGVITSQHFFIDAQYPIEVDLTSITFYTDILFTSFTTILISLIPMYIGMFKNSLEATQISSFVFIGIYFNNINGFSLSNSILATIGLVLISIAILHHMMKNIENQDIL